jgi:hypothetical protein
MERPHQAVIYIKAEVFDRLPDGRVSGNAIHKFVELTTIKGNSEEEVTKKTKDLLRKIKELCV